ncbi:MAG: transposase [Dokdonella sp.]
MLLKAVLLANSQGMVSSRAIARACRDNVLFISLTTMRSRTSLRSRTSSAARAMRSRWCLVRS